MNELLIYYLKVNIAIALFYVFYKLFFAQDTFLKTRRYYLLFSIMLSFAYPFLSLENWLNKQEPIQHFIAGYTLPEFVITPIQEVSIFSIDIIVFSVYLLVVAFLTVRLIVRLFSILKIRMEAKKELIENVSIFVVAKEITPFSFFGSIYMNPFLHTENEMHQILVHELTHVKQIHSFDVVFSELITILFWFNPITWLLKREVRQNLEFLADNKVIESGFDSKLYQYHLLQLSYQTPEIILANKFNVKPLKKRISMMNKQKTSKAGLLKYLLIIPLALALIVSSNAENIISSVKLGLKETQNDQTIEKLVNKPATKLDEIVVVAHGETQDNQKNIISLPPAVPGEVPPHPPVRQNKEIVFQVVEKMPLFPGGESAMMRYLAENIKYPVDAKESGTQGKVFCQFIVGADGVVDQVKILRSVSTSIDAEVVRLIKAMPVWTPGEQRGEKVAVQYVLPINFKLDGSKSGDLKIDSNKKPLIILNGKPQPAGFDVNSVKPEEIASVNVLKSTDEKQREEMITKYGAEAGNGVIEILTKK